MVSMTIVSIKDSRERRTFMYEQLERLGAPYRFFDAVDGRTLNESDLDRAAPGRGIHYCGLLTPAEIGCAMSHLEAIRQLAEGQWEFGAILEDDVLIEPAITYFLEEKNLRALPRFDVLQLCASKNKRNRMTAEICRIDGNMICAMPRCDYSMFGLIYSRNAARKIATTITKITAPIDSMLFFDCRVPSLRVLETHPNVIKHNDQIASVVGKRLRPMSVLSKVERERRRCFNAVRRWHNFVTAWGFQIIFKLRHGWEPRQKGAGVAHGIAQAQAI
jgi:GR25 family glycosyltransferase involved in LPS biosynthesis